MHFNFFCELMKFKKYFLLFIVLLLSFAKLCSHEITLCDALRGAKAGDFLVTAQSKTMTLFHIFEVQDSIVIIEEISAPIHLKSQIKGNWQDWINQDAEGHTSWIMYELNLNSRKIEDIYSFSQKSWQQVYDQEQIFPTLINLKFSLIDQKNRRKAGPAPLPEMRDDRAIWQPPIVSNGEKIPGIICDAYQAYWPQDGSELDGKKIEIFLAQNNEKVPAYFPFWLQVSNSFSQVKLRVIDSGFNLKSIHSNFPTPPVELLSQQLTPKGELSFTLKTHPLFENFTLFAKAIDGSGPIITLPCQVYQSVDKRQAQIKVTNEDLNNMLKHDKMYHFMLEPVGYPHMSVETLKPIGPIKRNAPY